MRIVIECNIACFTRHDTEQVSLIEIPIARVGRAANRAVRSARVLRAGVIIEVGRVDELNVQNMSINKGR
jgi:hypothetical protein